MKSNKFLKGILLSGTMIFAGLSQAQNSNPWPTTGAVGIGTSSPSQPLHVLINQPYPANPFPTALKLQNSAGSTRVGLDFLTYGTASEPARVARIEAIDMGSFRGALAFYTKSTTTQSDAAPIERMRISESGNVGIGVTPTSNRLEVNGNANINGTVFSNRFSIGTDLQAGVQAFNGLNLGNASGNIDARLGQTPTNNVILGWKYNAAIANAYAILETYGGNNSLILQSAGGKVGVGTLNPRSKFDAVGGQVELFTGYDNGPGILGTLKINGNPYTANVHGFAVTPSKNASGVPATGFGLVRGQDTESPIVWMYGGGNIYNAFQVRSVGWNDASLASSSLAFQVRTDGKVTIGTECFPVHTSGEVYSLAVNGRVLCSGLRVRTKPNADCSGWGDFVFENDYNLPTLEATEAYIQQNKHLPGIPSAKEVHENGYDVEEMLRLQMIKIEELTLHMIELKKENENLKKLIK